MSSIPDEIYLEIILRLPVKSTLVCKCVCKNWYALISNPNFVKKHHHLTIQKTNFHLIVAKQDYSTSLNVICSVSYDPSSVSPNEFHLYAVEIDGQPSFKFRQQYYWRYMNYSNGLVCVWCLEKNTFVLWNPDSKVCQELPKSPNNRMDERFCTYAFGYDYISGGSKIICVYDNSGGFGSVVDVYTMATNSWKNTQVIPYKFYIACDMYSKVFVNGVFHWICRRTDSSDNLIVSLDFRHETFKELQLPKEPLENGHIIRSSNLGLFKECLCILTLYVGNLEVWVMQDYGAQESWTRQYTITHENILKQFHSVSPMWVFNSGEILLASTGGWFKELILYDPKDGSARKPNLLLETKYLHLREG